MQNCSIECCQHLELVIWEAENQINHPDNNFLIWINKGLTFANLKYQSFAKKPIHFAQCFINQLVLQIKENYFKMLNPETGKDDEIYHVRFFSIVA